MDTKMKSLARHAVMREQNRMEKHGFRGDAIEGRSPRLDMHGAYAMKGAKLSEMEAKMNAGADHGGWEVKDEPTPYVAVKGSHYVYDYADMMPAVNKRVTVGDQMQPTPGHSIYASPMRVFDLDDDGF